MRERNTPRLGYSNDGRRARTCIQIQICRWIDEIRVVVAVSTLTGVPVLKLLGKFLSFHAAGEERWPEHISFEWRLCHLHTMDDDKVATRLRSGPIGIGIHE